MTAGGCLRSRMSMGAGTVWHSWLRAHAGLSQHSGSSQSLRPSAKKKTKKAMLQIEAKEAARKKSRSAVHVLQSHPCTTSTRSLAPFPFFLGMQIYSFLPSPNFGTAAAEGSQRRASNQSLLLKTSSNSGWPLSLPTTHGQGGGRVDAHRLTPQKLVPLPDAKIEPPQ